MYDETYLLQDGTTGVTAGITSNNNFIYVAQDIDRKNVVIQNISLNITSINTPIFFSSYNSSYINNKASTLRPFFINNYDNTTYYIESDFNKSLGFIPSTIYIIPVKETYSNIGGPLFIEGAPNTLEDNLLIYDYNGDHVKSHIINTQNLFGNFTILTPDNEFNKTISVKYKDQYYTIDHTKPMIRGYVSITIGTSVCVDSDFCIKAFTSEGRYLGNYEIDMELGECIIPNLDCNKTYSVMLYDRNKVIESRMLSHRTPIPYE